jgi:hypothetical protein
MAMRNEAAAPVEHRRRERLDVERGPGWLFVRVPNAAASGDDLASEVWETIREHSASRVVLELDRVETIDASLGNSIAAIGALVRDAGGLIRICGLTGPKLARLERLPVAAAVPHFETRSEAVGPHRNGSGPCE